MRYIKNYMNTLQLQIVVSYVNVSALIRNSMFVLALVASIAVKLSRLCSVAAIKTIIKGEKKGSSKKKDILNDDHDTKSLLEPFPKPIDCMRAAY